FNAALPDFLTLCMHSSPANFTWGNTASSAVFILPHGPGSIPRMWWTPVTPCTGLYLPIHVTNSRLPKPLTTAGRRGKTITPPPQAKADQFSRKSYWWLFRDLLDAIKGDETGTEFASRQPLARTTFDRLEQKWLARSGEVDQEAIRRKSSEPLEQFTRECFDEAVDAVKRLRKSIDS
ncbi:MAG: hypothetical protein VB859_20150, partial [Planctomycetaceae bacterium]